MNGTALLVIDVQRGFYDGDSTPPVFDSERVLERIGDVVRRARATGLPVVYVQHAGGSGHLLEQGSEGWQIHPEVNPRTGDVIVGKTTPDSFCKTRLKENLDSLGAESLIVMGNQTEFCVDTTCRSAHSLGYKVTLLKDGHSTWDNEHLKAQQIIDHHNLVLGRQFVSLQESGRFDFGQLL